MNFETFYAAWREGTNAFFNFQIRILALVLAFLLGGIVAAPWVKAKTKRDVDRWYAEQITKVYVYGPQCPKDCHLLTEGYDVGVIDQSGKGIGIKAISCGSSLPDPSSGPSGELRKHKWRTQCMGPNDKTWRPCTEDELTPKQEPTVYVDKVQP